MTKKRLSISKLRRLSGTTMPPTTTKQVNHGGKPQEISKEYYNNDDDDDDDDEEDDDDESEEEDTEPIASALPYSTKRKAVDPNEVEELFPPTKKQTVSSSAPLTTTVLTGINDFCNEKTVYIEGLPYEVTEEDIVAFFESCGCIESVRLPRWHDSNKLRGYGHVQFKNAAAAKKAIELDGCDLKGRYVKVDWPQTPRVLSHADRNKSNITRPAGCRSVFVKNIPYDSNETDMMDAFKVCGPITNVRLAMWGNTKQLKGFGYIDFKREDSAEIAVKKSGQLTVKGRPVIIDFETGVPKQSFKKFDTNKQPFNKKFENKKR